eukprot:TRINITY_DN8962_c0_g2_i3.p1 TRINITY_DN8962_c0_g2~~TRINITY_DN8962_c0_g2_i3.p1  ORF type:complete len:181 (+),score=46.67 TRINITY_DN8962_c0_g2_i3:49-591(+)
MVIQMESCIKLQESIIAEKETEIERLKNELSSTSSSMKEEIKRLKSKECEYVEIIKSISESPKSHESTEIEMQELKQIASSAREWREQIPVLEKEKRSMTVALNEYRIALKKTTTKLGESTELIEQLRLYKQKFKVLDSIMTSIFEALQDAGVKAGVEQMASIVATKLNFFGETRLGDNA